MIRGFGWFGNREGFGAVRRFWTLSSGLSQNASRRPSVGSVVSCVENSRERFKRATLQVELRQLAVGKLYTIRYVRSRFGRTIETAALAAARWRTGIQSANKL